ncbi:inositol monophosphatase family protein [Microvirga thermotolerans]|uniref:Inositol-1-monophosphatase n=1 Tax=Microvirga thermotolerans TaxID=2651334 RepID=A0A5P9JTU9_9HYPH|nr:inositol monophosphatase family protein [Microvirga thermotolerans]QFU15579.1 inositol monophosphatase [Microvirga thermotolerans]
MQDDLKTRFEAACEVAREAGALARRRFLERPRSQLADMKGPQDFLTATDSEVEELIRGRLLARFPGDAFFGEEGGGSFERDVWVVDPIDGTANFARGIPHFAISIAFIRDNRVEIGVVLDVMHDELYTARRGFGAALNGKAIRVSGLADIRQATVEAGWSSRLPADSYVAMVERLKHTGVNVRRGGSGTLGIAYVADGRIDAYCELHINAWDALAGLLIVEEAGGWTNNFLAGDGLRKGNPVLVSTPELADEISAATGIRKDPA